MSQANNPDNPADRSMSRSDFLRSFLKDHKTVGAVRETSRGVARRMAELAGVRNSSRIAEFGCGTGPITRVILDEMPADAMLWGYEVHEPFVQHLRRTIDDTRFTLFAEPAEKIVDHRAEHEIQLFDAIISTIPFSYLTHAQTIGILRAAIDSLTDEGRFVALQYHPTYLPPLLQREFDQVDRELYLWNLPPATLLTATKPRRL